MNALIDTVPDDEAHPLAGLMEIVGELIENYENAHYPMPEAEPREALQFLMEEHGLKQSDLAVESDNHHLCSCSHSCNVHLDPPLCDWYQ